MAEHADKTPDRKSQVAGHRTAQPLGGGGLGSGFVDKRAVGVMHGKLQEVADGSPRTKLQAIADNETAQLQQCNMNSATKLEKGLDVERVRSKKSKLGQSPKKMTYNIANNLIQLQKGSKRKKRFKNNNHTLKNFHPSTGVGTFNATYYPKKGLLVIKLNIHLDFVPARNMPENLLARLFRRQAPYLWTPEEENDFRERYVQTIKNYWDSKYTFKSIAPGYDEFRAIPKFEINFIAEQTKAAYSMTVPKVRDGEEIDAMVGFEQIEYRNPRTLINVKMGQNAHNDDIGGLNSQIVASDEIKRIDKLIKDNSLNDIKFHKGKSDISEENKDGIKKLAAGLMKWTSDVPKPNLNVQAGTKRDKQDAASLRRLRINAIVDVLKAEQIPETRIIENDKNTKKRNGLISIQDGFKNNFSNVFNTAAHEFGHMIGLPDEYTDLQGVDEHPGSVLQDNYTALLKKLGLTPPQFKQNNLDIMSRGTTVLPIHYATVWEVLGKTTDPVIKLDQWVME